MVKVRAIFTRFLTQGDCRGWLPALCAILLLAGCGKQGADSAPPKTQEASTAQAGSRQRQANSSKTQAGTSATQSANAWFPLGVGGQTIQVQLALTPAEQAQGLMGRKSLDPDHGMLFVFERGKRQSFWMANTPLPLDIGYFDNDGVLREVYPLYPFDRTSVVSQRSDIRYALEMEQGWFARNGVRPGARIDSQMLDAALAQRR